MRKSLSDIAQQALLQPQESLLKSGSSKKSLSIGIPKENFAKEKRVPITPLSVGLLVNNGHEVLIESGAGLGANFSDNNYSEQGALIVYAVEEVYKAEIILKTSSPTEADIELMSPKQILISSLSTKSITANCFKKLIEKKITALAFENLTDENGNLCIVHAMSEIVGSTAIFIAAEYLSNASGGKGLMLGSVTGVPPTEIVILGAGTVAEQATKTALALGADVKVFDKSLNKLKRLRNNVGHPVFTSIIQPYIMEKAIKTCDIVIGAIRAHDGHSPCLISEDTVSKMKPRSVIIDVSIDQGGCFETSEPTTHEQPIFWKHDVIHYCVPNIASRVPRTASYALTNILAPLVVKIGDQGGVSNLIWNDSGVRDSVYLFQGQATNIHLAEKFNMPYKDLNLLALPKI